MCGLQQAGHPDLVTVALWDSLGTLLDLEPVEARFVRAGAAHGLEGWFERIVHTGAALTLLGEFHPFVDVAESTLPAVLAQLGLPPDERGPLDALHEELRPHHDAAEALDILDEARVRSLVVTNGGRGSTEQALARGGLAERFADIVSIDDVRVWKPHRAPYEEALGRAGADGGDTWLIAAHAWDVQAAVTYGLSAVWVDRIEQRRPLPTPESRHRVGDLPAAARLVAAHAAG